MSQLPCPDSKDPLKLLCEHAQRGTELRDKGFTKQVRRDDGIHENATARDGESRYVRPDKPETLPNLKKIIRD